MEDVLCNALAQEGGQLEKLVKSVLTSVVPVDVAAACQPKLGTQILPMAAETPATIESGLAALGEGSIFADWRG